MGACAQMMNKSKILITNMHESMKQELRSEPATEM
jgi:hypothetical protein